jgi:hypothetical protein
LRAFEYRVNDEDSEILGTAIILEVMITRNHVLKARKQVRRGSSHVIRTGRQVRMCSSHVIRTRRQVRM